MSSSLIPFLITSCLAYSIALYWSTAHEFPILSGPNLSLQVDILDPFILQFEIYSFWCFSNKHHSAWDISQSSQTEISSIKYFWWMFWGLKEWLFIYLGCEFAEGITDFIPTIMSSTLCLITISRFWSSLCHCVFQFLL